MTIITYEDFEKVDLRSGTAQITHHYTPESLIGRSVVGCINLGERNIAGFISQFLLVGFADENKNIALIKVDPNVPNGQKLY